MELAGRVALVTGGGSGIGEATVAELAGRGATVVVADVDERAGRRVAEATGGRHLTLDVASSAAWDAAVASIRSHEGALHLVHLNAGITGGETPLDALTDELYRRVVGVNLDGVVFGLRATMPMLREAGEGAVVVTSSMAGIVPYAPDPVYTLTKQAVVGLVRGLAPELSLDAVTINVVCPGLVDTPMMAAARELFVAAGLDLVDPADVARAVADLMAGRDSGQAVRVLPGEPPSVWRFAGPPAMGAELVEIRRRDPGAPGPT